jgi:hypothetical protein
MLTMPVIRGLLHPAPALILRLNRQKGNLKRKVFDALRGGTR